MGFPGPTSKCGGKEKGVFREAQYPGRSGGGDGVPRNIPPTPRRVPDQGNTPAGPAMQIDQLIGSLTGLGCSAAGSPQTRSKLEPQPNTSVIFKTSGMGPGSCQIRKGRGKGRGGEEGAC